MLLTAYLLRHSLGWVIIRVIAVIVYFYTDSVCACAVLYLFDRYLSQTKLQRLPVATWTTQLYKASTDFSGFWSMTVLSSQRVGSLSSRFFMNGF